MDSEQKKRLGRPATYGWDDWLQRNQLEIRRGVDYHCSTYSMAQQVRTAAKKRELVVHIEVAADDSSLLIRIMREGDGL